MRNSQNLRWVGACAACLLLSATVHAAPSWNATGLTVAGPDAGKVVAALDALFGSKVGRKMPGRVSLRANLADGANPETHTVVVLTESAAEREAFVAELYASDAWAEFLEEMSGLSRTPGSTMRGVIAWNAGDRSDSDVVWINHYLSVSEPAVLVNAMNTYNDSPSGQAVPSQVHLSAIVAAGPGAPSHIISIGWASEAEMEASIAKQQADPAYRVLVDTMLSGATYHGANLQREVKAWGDISVEDVTDTGN